MPSCKHAGAQPGALVKWESMEQMKRKGTQLKSRGSRGKCKFKLPVVAVLPRIQISAWRPAHPRF